MLTSLLKSLRGQAPVLIAGRKHHERRRSRLDVVYLVVLAFVLGNIRVTLANQRIA
jgi:hypothetical protein